MMGMRVEQALADAIRAARDGDADAGLQVDRRDSVIDREEVEIEQECIRLLALYQPTAIDLRTICTVIKANSDLERIADLAASIGRRTKHVVEDSIDMQRYPHFDRLAEATTDVLGKTVRMLNATDITTARTVIESDDNVDQSYGRFVRHVLDAESGKSAGAKVVMTLINLAKALERVGDLCTNIAEDIIFLKTGDIIRHAEAMEEPPATETTS